MQKSILTLKEVIRMCEYYCNCDYCGYDKNLCEFLGNGAPFCDMFQCAANYCGRSECITFEELYDCYYPY